MGQSLSFKKIESQDELSRLSHVEEVLKNCVRLQDYIFLKKEMENTFSDVEKCQYIVDHFSVSFEKDLNKLEKFIVDSIKAIDIPIPVDLSEIKEKICSLKNGISKVEKDLDQKYLVLKEIQSNQNNFVTKSAFKSSLDQHIFEQKNIISSFMRDANQLKESLRKEVFDYMSLLKISHDEVVFNIGKEISELNKSLISQNEELKERIKFVENQHIKFRQENLKEIEILRNKIASLMPNDDIPVMLQKEIEPLRLDAKNSVIRSSNNESRVNILEKKMEQLQLKLKSIELKSEA